MRVGWCDSGRVPQMLDRVLDLTVYKLRFCQVHQDVRMERVQTDQFLLESEPVVVLASLIEQSPEIMRGNQREKILIITNQPLQLTEFA